MKHPIHWFIVLFAVTVTAVVLAGCAKPPVDPVEQCRILTPKVADALNKRDLDALKDLGTDAFDPNRFITDVYAHGYSGTISLSVQRFRQVPGENRLVLNATFGPNQTGGVKELTLMLVGEKQLKIDTYTLEDMVRPSAKPGAGTPPAQGR